MLLKVPVLWQIFTESICVQEHADDRGYCVLHSQLLGTADSIVRDMGSQRFYIPYHAVERTAGTDGFLFCKLLIRHHVLTVQFLPGADDVDVVERQPYPVLVVLCKLIGSLYTEGL